MSRSNVVTCLLMSIICHILSLFHYFVTFWNASKIQSVLCWEFPGVIPYVMNAVETHNQQAYSSTASLPTAHISQQLRSIFCLLPQFTSTSNPNRMFTRRASRCLPLTSWQQHDVVLRPSSTLPSRYIMAPRHERSQTGSTLKITVQCACGKFPDWRCKNTSSAHRSTSKIIFAALPTDLILCCECNFSLSGVYMYIR